MDRDEGQASVETALACTILFALLFGIMQIALALYAYHFIAEAARLATRYASVRGSSCTGMNSACPASATDVQNYVTGLDYPGINDAYTTVTTTWPGAGATCTPSSSPCNNPGNTVQVKIQYLWTFPVPFIRNAVTFNMTSTSATIISN